MKMMLYFPIKGADSVPCVLQIVPRVGEEFATKSETFIVDRVVHSAERDDESLQVRVFLKKGKPIYPVP